MVPAWAGETAFVRFVLTGSGWLFGHSGAARTALKSHDFSYAEMGILLWPKP